MVPILKAMAKPGHSEANKYPWIDLIPDRELYPHHKSGASKQVGKDNTWGCAKPCLLVTPDKDEGLDHDQYNNTADQSARA